ncbi:MAG: hypothetical protein AB7F66_01905 [Bacteriovoracia bacterium]
MKSLFGKMRVGSVVVGLALAWITGCAGSNPTSQTGTITGNPTGGTAMSLLVSGFCEHLRECNQVDPPLCYRSIFRAEVNPGLLAVLGYPVADANGDPFTVGALHQRELDRVLYSNPAEISECLAAVGRLSCAPSPQTPSFSLAHYPQASVLPFISLFVLENTPSPACLQVLSTIHVGG